MRIKLTPITITIPWHIEHLVFHFSCWQPNRLGPIESLTQDILKLLDQSSNTAMLKYIMLHYEYTSHIKQSFSLMRKSHAFLACCAFSAFLRLLRIITSDKNDPTTAIPNKIKITGIRIAQTRGGKREWSAWSSSTNGCVPRKNPVLVRGNSQTVRRNPYFKEWKRLTIRRVQTV